MKTLLTTSAVAGACLVTFASLLLSEDAAHVGSEVALADASAISGGQCGMYQNFVGGACTDSQDDSCTTVDVVCNGTCDYYCIPTITFGGSGTFSGALDPTTCGNTTLPDCDLTDCLLGSLYVPCCMCLGGTDIACGPPPVDLDTDACSGGHPVKLVN